MALRKPLFMSTEGFSEEMALTDSITLGGLTMGGDIAMGTHKITGMGDGSAPQDAVTKSQLDAAVIQGGQVKEILFDQNQLDNTDGINAAEVVFFENQPAVGDTVVLTDGVLTRTYTFVLNQGAESAATDVSIETDAATAMQRFVTRMLADAGNTVWDSVFRATEHPDIHVDGIIVVYEKASAAGASPSRIYGTWTTQSDLRVVEFASGATPDVDVDYSDETAATASTSDPAAGRFGLRRIVSALETGEIHYVMTNDYQYAWDDDALQWNILTGGGAVPDATSASGGGIKGKVTFDSDKGLSVTSGIAEVKIDAVTIDFSGGSLAVTGVPLQFEINGAATSTAVTSANLGTLTAGVASDAQSLHTHGNLATAGHTHAQLHDRSHAITSTSDHTESGLTIGHVLTATGAATFGWAAPAGVDDAKRLENVLNTAVDVTANGDPVYWNGADTVGKARADTDAKAHVMGVIKSGGGAAPASVAVISHGTCAGVLTTAVANTNYFLQATGGIGTSLPGGGNRVIRVGWARNTSDLWVAIHDYGKRAA